MSDTPPDVIQALLLTMHLTKAEREETKNMLPLVAYDYILTRRCKRGQYMYPISPMQRFVNWLRR